MSSAGDWALTSPAATLLARRHGLPCDCYGADTSARTLDMQAGYQQALPTLVGALGRPRFLSGVGAWTETGTCLELLVLDDALYGAALAALEPPDWQSDALDVEAMIEGVTSPAGFLGTRHTRSWARRIRASEELSFRGSPEVWRATGATDVVERAGARVAELVARGPLGLPDDVEAELCRIIDEAAAALGLPDWPDPRRLLESARA
jgi:trimethylamine:corrinoid methyltransferase-like protein